MKKKYIFLLVLIIILQLITLRPVFRCSRWDNQFHFSSLNLKLQINSAIFADQNVPNLLTRAMHNKITYFVLDVFRRYMYFTDFKFLLSYLLPVGLIGFLTAIYFIFKNKIFKCKYRDFWVIIFSFSILTHLFEIIFNPGLSFILKTTILLLPHYLLSSYGIYKLLEKRTILVILLLIISVMWLQVYSQEILNFCMV